MESLIFSQAIKSITPKSKINASKFQLEGKYPIISQEATLISGYWDLGQDVMRIEKPVVIYGDHTRNVKYVDFDFVVGADGVKIFLPVDELDAKYLYYWLLAHPVKSLGYARHYRLLKDSVITFPTLEIQRAIVSKLDDIFQKIDKSIELLKISLTSSNTLRSKYIEDYMAHAAGSLKQLSDICKFENGDRGKNYPSKSKQTVSGIPFINAGNLNRSKIDFEGMTYISQDTFDKLGGGKIKKNDILFCLRGSLGKFATVGDLNQGAIASSLVIIRPDIDQALVDYLLYYFEGEQCKRMITRFENGTAQPNLSAGSLKKFEINLPSTSKQMEVIKSLNHVTHLIDETVRLRRKKIQNLEALKHNLLIEALSGSAVK